MLNNINIYKIIEIAKKAGEEILKVYNVDFEVDFKDDKSPLTLADKVSNEIICDGLSKLFPEIPIISEENKEIDYKIRKDWKYCWIIDPLDGTKEFINKNGEFTVNIAFVENGVPILGVVYAPVIDTLYYAKKGEGAFKNEFSIPIKRNDDLYKVVASKSHINDETKEYINNIKTKKEIEFISMGSSLKLCLVAEGAADIYPRLAPTMEWDTAAAHAICIEARKNVYDIDNIPLVYNKEILLNNWFIVK